MTDLGFKLIIQDLEDGGIGDRPGDWVDVFHTIFGVAGTSSSKHLSATRPPVSPPSIRLTYPERLANDQVYH